MMSAGPACPICSARLRPGVAFCDICRVAIRLEGQRIVPVFPEIRPGEVLTSLDFSKDPLPSVSEKIWKNDSGVTTAPGNHGVTATMAKSYSSTFYDSSLRLRDACVRLSVTTHEPDIHVGVVARVESIGAGRTQYQLELKPEQRAVRLSKFFASAKTVGHAVIFPWTQYDAVAPINYVNDVELRVQGPTLQGWVNGVNVLAAHDLSFCIGSAGLRFARDGSSFAGPVRLTYHRLDIRQVMA